MTEEVVVQVGRQAIFHVLLGVAPVLGLGLLTGLVVSILQATTQIQEQTLAFIPKIIAVMGALIVFGPWIMNLFSSFAENLIMDLPTLLQ